MLHTCLGWRDVWLERLDLSESECQRWLSAFLIIFLLVVHIDLIQAGSQFWIWELMLSFGFRFLADNTAHTVLMLLIVENRILGVANPAILYKEACIVALVQLTLRLITLSEFLIAFNIGQNVENTGVGLSV